MKSFPTKKSIEAQCKTGRSYYGFVRRRKGIFALAEIVPGRGYAPIYEFEVSSDEASFMLFQDLFTQLKAIFDFSPEELTRNH